MNWWVWMLLCQMIGSARRSFVSSGWSPNNISIEKYHKLNFSQSRKTFHVRQFHNTLMISVVSLQILSLSATWTG